MINELCLLEIRRAHQTERSASGESPGSSQRLLVQAWGQKGGQPESWEDLQWELWEVMLQKKEGLEDRSTGKAGEEVRFG